MNEQTGPNVADTPPKPSGYQHRVIHLDAVAEALSRTKRKGQRAPRRQLRDIALRQIKRAERIQKLLDSELTLARETKTEISAVLVQAAQTAKSLTDTMMNAIEQVRRSDKAEAEKLGGLTDEQLHEVLKVQLDRVIWNDNDKRRMLTHWFGVDVANVLVPVKEEA